MRLLFTNIFLEKFGEIYADKFRKNLIHFLNLLSTQPLIGRPSKNNPTL